MTCSILISIHSPHARGDRPRCIRRSTHNYFNPLPSCEGRLFHAIREKRRRLFQSTPLMRGETRIGWTIWPDRGHFNPLPSCEGRPGERNLCANDHEFQSTPLMRGETANGASCFLTQYISIHSSHARGDPLSIIVPSPLSVHFNPLPSCEGRPLKMLGVMTDDEFQSTPLMRGETLRAAIAWTERGYFNPLPSCEGRQADQSGGKRAAHFNPLPSCEWRQNERHIHHSGHYFNPLPSCEGRPKIINPSWYMLGFQSTPFMRGETTIDKLLPRHKPISIHSPHARGDAYQDGSDKTHQHFNPLPLCEGRPVLKANWLT